MKLATWPWRLALCVLLFIDSQYTVDSACIFGCNNDLASPFGLSSFPLFGKLWWLGPNVCDIIETEETAEPTTDSDNWTALSNSTYQTYSQVCRDYRNAHVCTTTVVSNGTVKKTISGRRCCEGYERGLGGYGCQKEAPVLNLVETLKRLNLTVLASAFERSKAQDAFAGKRVTVFAPANAALTKNSTNNNGISHVVVFETGDELQPVRDILFGTVVNGELNSWKIADKDTLKTLKNQGNLIITHRNLCCNQAFLVNCASVTQSDVAFENGVIHVINALIQPAENTLWELLNSNPNFTKFVSLVTLETKKKLMNPNSQITVFAFSNEAYERLPESTKRSIETGGNCYNDLINYHTLKEPICKSTLNHLARIGSMFGIFQQGCHAACLPNGADAVVKVEGTVDGQIMVGNSTIVSDNVIAKNGILYTVSDVILPAEMQSPLENLGRWSVKMQSMLKASDLMEKMSGTDYSILLPPVKAVNEIDLESDLHRKKESLAKYVMNGDLSGQKSEISNLANQSLNFKRSPQFSWMLEKQPAIGYLNCIKVLSSKIDSCGGKVYRLTNSLAQYDTNIMSLLRKNPELKQFVMLVEAAGFADVLSSPNDAFTVMAFTDKKFDSNFDEKTKNELMNDRSRLQQFIGNHILNGSYCCSDMANGMFSFFDEQTFGTLAGTQKIVSGIDEYNLRYGSSGIAMCNFGTAKNGVVHLLEAPDIKRKALSIWRPLGISFIDHPFDNIFRLF